MAGATDSAVCHLEDLTTLPAGRLSALLGEEVRNWRARLHWDFSTSAELVTRYVNLHALDGLALIHGSEVVLSFTHTDGGLVAKEGALKGFAIAGADKKWVRATAKLEGNKVIVSSPDVKEPAAVRYAWADNPEFNLYNGAGLPASPFRTDKW